MKIASLRLNGGSYGAVAVAKNVPLTFDLFKLTYPGRRLTPEEIVQMKVSAPHGLTPWLTTKGEVLAFCLD